MRSWVKVAVGVGVPGAAIILLVLGAICLHCRRRPQKPLGSDKLHTTKSTNATLQSGIGCLRQSYRSSDAANLRFHHLHRHDHAHHHHRELHRLGSDFSWAKHPRLMTEAVEGGWSRFAFVGRPGSLPWSAPSLLGSCVACDHERPEPEVGWEVPMGSSDFMQTVRLNPGGGSGGPMDGEASYSTAMMSLPLPGPPLGGDPPSFPQEAYFEITILHLQRPQHQNQHQHRHHLRWSKRVKDSSGDGDRKKLISENPASVFSGADGGLAQEPSKVPDEEEQSKQADVTVCFGLTRGGAPSEKLPGRYPGSIGFNSDGSVYLDGIKLVFPSEKERWGAVNRVVGCGFDPGKKTVFFTMDAVLLHVIRCNSDDFRSPLYPALAANADAMVSVNLGQCPFKYPPANAQRTPNPCFLRPAPTDPSAHIGYDDSRELFSMGRIDSQWLVGVKKSQFGGSRNCCRDGGSVTDGSVTDGSVTDGDVTGREEEDRGDGDVASTVVDIDAESDLFEIALNR